jgi:hypothetical protein
MNEGGRFCEVPKRFQAVLLNLITIWKPLSGILSHFTPSPFFTPPFSVSLPPDTSLVLPASPLSSGGYIWPGELNGLNYRSIRARYRSSVNQGTHYVGFGAKLARNSSWLRERNIHRWYAIKGKCCLLQASITQIKLTIQAHYFCSCETLVVGVHRVSGFSNHPSRGRKGDHELGGTSMISFT